MLLVRSRPLKCMKLKSVLLFQVLLICLCFPYSWKVRQDTFLLLGIGKIIWFNIEYETTLLVFGNKLYSSILDKIGKIPIPRNRLVQQLLKPNLNNQRLQHLDAIRGFASVIVVVFHSFDPFFTKKSYIDEVDNDSNHPLHTVRRRGDSMVQLFVVLSGYIMSKVYWNEKRGSNLYQMLMSRATRFYPLHWLCAITYAGAALYFHWHYNSDRSLWMDTGAFGECLRLTHVWRWNWEWNVADICNGPSWSLSLEWLVNIVMFICIRYAPVFVSMTIFELFTYIGYYGYVKSNTSIPTSETAAVVYAFYFGILVHRLTFWIQNRIVAIGLIFDIISIYHLSCWRDWIVKMPTNVEEFENFYIGYWRIEIVSYTSVLIVLLNNSFFVKKLLSMRLFIFLGEISFAAYLSQYPIRMILSILRSEGLWSSDDAIGVLGFLMIVVAVSTVLHYLFEIPFKKHLDEYFKVGSKFNAVPKSILKTHKFDMDE